MEKYSLDKGQIVALESASHSDPFAVLGPHLVKDGTKTTVVIRSLQPHAKSVSILQKGKKKPVAMKKISDGGLFELHFPKASEIFAYQLVITPEYGDAYTISDAFSFGPLLSDFDLQLWGEGNHRKAYETLGAHLMEVDGVKGTRFVVSAPSASRVSVIGSFNEWDGRRHPMRKYHDQGLWEIFMPEVTTGDAYKYEIKSDNFALPFKKADPYAFYAEKRPNTASIVANLDDYEWQDEDWMSTRKKNFNEALSIYEVHLGSWKRKDGEIGPEFLTYRDLAEQLIPYVKELGFTHIELLPIAEHPYDPSWGYQITGYFAATSRFGTPQDFMYFVDECHKNGIGVIVDWVPAHFAKDEHGLRLFDGTHLYEHADPRQGEHKDWGTCIFNYGRTEVQNFLLSNAVFWCDKFHIDGLRVDAVASMLYLDYSREEGEWIPNKYGGRENLEAIAFLKKTNEVLNQEFENIITFAEESTSWPMVSKPTYLGGLGFDYKWNMGWMNDTLKYIEIDPIFRRYHHNQLTFSMIYAFTENFMLPFSHDEVVHMKRSMLSKMPGDDWQKFANLRLLYTYMYAHPGKKLLFMGNEIGQWGEWNSVAQLDWPLLKYDTHKGIHTLVKDLNHAYSEHKPLHEVDFDWNGFEWIDFSDIDNSIVAFLRYSADKKDFRVCIFNFTPQPHMGYRFGVPKAGAYDIILNSDSKYYGGSNVENGHLEASHGQWHNQPATLTVNIPPLAGLILKPVS